MSFRTTAILAAVLLVVLVVCWITGVFGPQQTSPDSREQVKSQAKGLDQGLLEGPQRKEAGVLGSDLWQNSS